MLVRRAATQDPGWLQESHENRWISSLFPECQKSWKLVPRAPKNKQNRFQDHQNSDFCDKLVFAIPSIRKPCLKIPDVRISTQKSVSKVTWKRARKQHQISSPRCPKSFRNAVPKSCQNRWKSDLDPQVSFLLLAGSPRVHPRCENGIQECQNGVTRSPKSQFWAPKWLPFPVSDIKMLWEQTPTTADKFSETRTGQQKQQRKKPTANANKMTWN